MYSFHKIFCELKIVFVTFTTALLHNLVERERKKKRRTDYSAVDCKCFGMNNSARETDKNRIKK